MTNAVRPLVVREGRQEVIYDPRLKTFAPVRDRAAHFAGQPPRRVPAHEIESFLGRREARGAGVHALGQLQAGVSFRSGQLTYKESTAAYYYLLAPLTKGGPPDAQLLYMTATNRSFQGCEALIAYSAPTPYAGTFRVWDWYSQRAKNTNFVLNVTLEKLGAYLIPYTIGDDVQSNALYVISATRRLDGGPQWVNEVYLHNHQTGERDRVWQNFFPWPTPPADDEWGWWGPIFEAFPDNTALGPCSPIGFDGALLVQDGHERPFTDANTVLAEPVGDGLTKVYRAGNSGFVAR